MLYAYAAMRGNFDKAYPHLSDPLHSALYLIPYSYVNPRFERPANLPRWQLEHDPGMFDEYLWHFCSSWTELM